MLNKIKAFFKEHIEEILVGTTTVFVCTTVILGLFSAALVAMTNDLVEVVDMRNTEVEELKIELQESHRSNIILKQTVEDIQTTYENSVPKLEYDSKIQYYESVIDELVTQCQKECKQCGN